MYLQTWLNKIQLGSNPSGESLSYSPLSCILFIEFLFYVQKLLQSTQVKRTPPRLHKWIYYSKVESVGSCRFQIHVCILAWVISREFTGDSVTKFLPAKFSWIWRKCLLWNLTHLKIFNLTKYREVLVKYSLLSTHAGMPIWI